MASVAEFKKSMPIRLIDKWSVGETPTEATETVALPGTQILSANRIGMKKSFLAKNDKVENREYLERLRVNYLGREKGFSRQFCVRLAVCCSVM